MDRNKIKERLELALRPAEPPTLEEVLEHVSRHGVLRGPVDWVFPAWMLYVEYATQKIAEAFPLSEEEKKQLFHFRDALTRLLREAWAQAKEKLTALYKAVAEGTYQLEGNKLYASDIVLHVNRAIHMNIYGLSAEAYFPNILKLSQERLKWFQLGWAASDEGRHGNWPLMNTAQPWQVFAWVATRYGKLYVRVDSINLTRKGISIVIELRAKNWTQLNKEVAIEHVVQSFKQGNWAPLLTMWLGDGVNTRNRVLSGEYELIISSKNPQRLGQILKTGLALVTSGKEAFIKLREVAGIYGNLLDLLSSHKWFTIKLATDDAFKAAYKQRCKNNKIRIGDVLMHLELGIKGSLYAKRYTCNLDEALMYVEKLKQIGIKANIVRSKSGYAVYISTTNLLELAKKNENIRKTISKYLIDKAKNGTPKQREAATKLLNRHPFFVIGRQGVVPRARHKEGNAGKRSGGGDPPYVHRGRGEGDRRGVCPLCCRLFVAWSDEGYTWLSTEACFYIS
jgi:hypothetical protein